MLKLIPEKIGIFRDGRYVPDAPVTSVRIHPPGMHPTGAPIVATYHACEIVTPYGVRWYGFTRAWITSGLRVAVEINERDEVLRKWEPSDES